MFHPIARRRFLRGLGNAACAGAVAWSLPRTGNAAAFEALDRSERLRLADMAIDLARRAGASHCDLRICRYQTQRLAARDNRLEDSQSGLDVGLGVRLLKDGMWGFAAAEIVDEASVRQAVAAAAENAAAMRRLGAAPITLEPLSAYEDDWVMPMAIDPFSVPEPKRSTCCSRPTPRRSRPAPTSATPI
jgi:PmbA/TldA metallopeptidase domain 1